MKLSRSRVVAAVAAVTVAASGAGVATAFAESPRVLQPQDAVVAKLGGTPLNVRSAPNTSSVGTVGYVPGPHIHLEYRVQDAGTATGWRIVDPRTRLG